VYPGDTRPTQHQQGTGRHEIVLRNAGLLADYSREIAVEEIEDPQEVERAEPIEPVAQALQSTSIIDGEEHAVDPRSVTLDRIVGLASILVIALIPFIGVTIGWGLDGIPTRIVGLASILVIALIPFIGVTIGWGLDGIPTRVYLPLLVGGVALFVISLVLGYTWPELHHRHLRYRVDESGVRIRRGVLWRTVISIPASRVQHTDVSQGPLQRNYELATLTVHTAGTQGASIELSGLEHSVARRLRDHLLPDHDANVV